MHDQTDRAKTGLVIGLDADDTLWHNEDLFAHTEQRFRDLMQPWADGPSTDAALVARQRERVRSYGFGAKAFGLAMVRTACELSDNQIGAGDLQTIVTWTDELLAEPTNLIDGALEAVQELHDRAELYIFTKGDLNRQLQRIEESKLARWCVDVEVMATKDAATYARLLSRHQIDPGQFIMIGNSLVSDVYPVVEIGARAIHIPYAVTWALEQTGDEPKANDRWRPAATLAEAVSLVDQLPWI